MVKFILFMDSLRQEEIDKFYDACQMHRDYYRGVPKRYHPLAFFREPQYAYQCPEDMPSVYLSFPDFHVKYKTPLVLATELGATSGFPELPGRTLAGRFNKTPCKAFVR